MNVQQAKNSAAAFFIASRRCLEERQIGSHQFEMVLVPGIVCAVFSIELGFKAIILSARGKASGHKLLELFNRLGPSEQNQIIRALGIDRPEFMIALQAISDAFVQWRYIYEYPGAQIDMGFLDKLAVATQATVAQALGDV